MIQKSSSTFTPLSAIPAEVASRLLVDLPSVRAIRRAESLHQRTVGATIASALLFVAALINGAAAFLDPLAGFLTVALVCPLLLYQAHRSSTEITEITEIKNWILCQGPVRPHSIAWLRELEAAQDNDTARALLRSPKSEADVSYIRDALACS